ncbi:HAMP domain-containing methyl-accepting chemotaxis protein [Marinomonas spartinae]|uniref:HAMP domain-containing methyl-accepting chemotaxis protein n=1 Tax=Marinomonas spartinae TaxID=1792290 RepID=UPI0018F1506D|nr:methyl-accepting chemotaxis protein [Marinomonas spartinae]MBJ7555658.1 methyl-accepting chemotaxis protein [Marinomonas spartinae]
MMNFLENRLIGTKLALGFGSVLILTLIVGITSLYGVSSLLSRADKVRLSNELDHNIVDMQVAREHFVTSGSEADKAKLMDLTRQLSDKLAKSNQLYNGPDVLDLIQKTSQSIAEYEKTLTPLAEARKKWDDVDKQAKNLLSNIYNQYDLVAQALKKNNDQNNASEVLTIETSFYSLTSFIDSIITKGQPIPVDEVTSRLNTVIEKTKALQLPDNLQSNQQKILTLLDQYREMGKRNPEVTSKLYSVKDQLLALSKSMNNNIDAITHLQEQKSKADGSEINSLVIAVTVIAILIGIFFALLIRHMITKPMSTVIQAVEKISSGDFTQQLHTERRDELGKLLNHIGDMSKTLNRLISEVVSGVMNLSSTSEQLEAISKQGQSMMQSQRDETDQVATAINEMASTVTEVARNTETAAEASTKADEIVGQGNVMVNSAVKLIESLAEDLNVTSQAMEQLKSRTDNVGNVLEVIKAVAEQTNLLALNAAIEAARAGEAGRGFAVVADEVRGLASRTQSSAKEIEDLIIELQNGAQESLTRMMSSRDMSMENAEKAKGVLTLFKDINEQVGYAQDMNQQIATAAEEQSHVSEEISRSVENVRELADRTNEGALESVRAVTNLRTISHQLKTLTDRFKI